MGMFGDDNGKLRGGKSEPAETALSNETEERKLLKKALTYLESIKEGDGYLIILIGDIKEILSPTIAEKDSKKPPTLTNLCTWCDGSGVMEYPDGHGCWGETLYSSKKCTNCGGRGCVVLTGVTKGGNGGVNVDLCGCCN